MYTDTTRPNHLAQEVIDNAVDEALAGHADKITVTVYKDGSLSVEDNGRGMPPEVPKRIFDPFFTTKPVGQGTGLGLSISFKIIQDHGGSIRVASEPGGGTRFLIRLPRPQACQLKESA